MLVVFLDAYVAVIVVAEDLEREHAVPVPHSREAGVEAGEQRPGGPLEDVEEGGLH